LLEVTFRLFDWVLIHSQQYGIQNDACCNCYVEIFVYTNNKEEFEKWILL
jgi:hypothetical protein